MKQKTDKKANFAAQAVYYREIGKLFLILAKQTEKKSKEK